MSEMHDKFWHAAAGVSPIAPWLRDPGSLTLRIQRRCTDFAVHKVHSGLARIPRDEARLLGVIPHHMAFTRDVFLYADGLPVVFAHSTCAATHLRGAWSAVGGLGNQPLGALLFSHPLTERKSLHFKLLKRSHALYKRAAATLTNPPDSLWARRSLFYLHGAPLLVTEVFLPEITRLPRFTS
jgi:chorismate lyase